MLNSWKPMLVQTIKSFYKMFIKRRSPNLLHFAVDKTLSLALNLGRVKKFYVFVSCQRFHVPYLYPHMDLH